VKQIKTVASFCQITSPEALHNAWQLFSKGKQKRADVQHFWLRLERNILALHRDLARGEYQHGPYESFFITDPKRRHIRKACVRDRIVHQALHTALSELYEPILIHDVYSGRVKKGVHSGVNSVAAMIRQVGKNNTRPCWALKCDIQKFYDSVCHETLLQLVAKRVRDPQTVELVRKVIGSFSVDGQQGRGLPIGNLTSQVFTNIFLHELDQFVKHELRVKQYARFSDDFVLLSHRRSELDEWLAKVRTFLAERLRLSLHPNKVTVRPLHQGIDFLGVVLLPHHRVLRTTTRRRMIRRLEQIFEGVRDDLEAAEALSQSIASYTGLLSHVNAWQLSLLIRNQFVHAAA
jgi:RNA-directed DNA polymerase